MLQFAQEPVDSTSVLVTSYAADTGTTGTADDGQRPPPAASWCAATSCPAPASVGLASPRRPTLQPCRSSCRCRQQGQPCRVRREASATAQVRAVPAPPRGDPDHSVPRTAFPTKPRRKELRSGQSSGQGNAPLPQRGRALALQTLPKSRTAPITKPEPPACRNRRGNITEKLRPQTASHVLVSEGRDPVWAFFGQVPSYAFTCRRHRADCGTNQGS